MIGGISLERAILIEKILLFIGSGLFAFALYLFICEIRDVPSHKADKTMKKASQQDGAKHDDEIDLWLDTKALELSNTTSRFIHLSDERRIAMENALHITHSRLTPDSFVAKLCIFYAIYMLFFLLFTALIGSLWIIPVGLAGSGIMVARDYKKLMGAVEKRRKRIEAECASFSAYLSSCLSAGMNHIPSLFNSYRKAANSQDFADELERTVADMETSSVDRALTRMDARVNSPYMTKIVRGLLQQLTGTDQKQYFHDVAYQMQLDKAAAMEKIAIQRKDKTAIYNMAIYFGVIAVIIIAIGVDLLNSIGGIF